MLDMEAQRQQFPALNRRLNGMAQLFLDGPAGTQVPQSVIDAIGRYLTDCNANHGGAFATSVLSDRLIDDAHQAMADFLHAPASDEIIFGANMTTLTLHLSRSLGRTWKPGDEIILTRLDHDANFTPWALAARDVGATVRICDLRPDDCTLDLQHLRTLLNAKTKLVAVCCASNAVGSLVDVAAVTRWAHEVGAKVYLDAVHYAPHGLIDVQAWDCDFLVCSAYKFFGPHIGILWGKRQWLDELPAYKLRPAPDTLPGKWMTGTQNFECIAGVAAAVEYLADLGRTVAPQASGRRPAVVAAMAAIQQYERELGRRLLQGLAQRPRFTVHGITSLDRLGERVPTFAVSDQRFSALELAQHLAARQIYAWHGNYYAMNLMERLGMEERGGLLRFGLVHYNTAEEVDRLLHALDQL